MQQKFGTFKHSKEEKKNLDIFETEMNINSKIQHNTIETGAIKTKIMSYTIIKQNNISNGRNSELLITKNA